MLGPFYKGFLKSTTRATTRETHLSSVWVVSWSFRAGFEPCLVPYPPPVAGCELLPSQFWVGQRAQP
jgi:hypothetical protein